MTDMNNNMIPRLQTRCVRESCENKIKHHIVVVFFNPGYTPPDDFDFLMIVEKETPAITVFSGGLCEEHRPEFDDHKEIADELVDGLYRELATSLLASGILGLPTREDARLVFATEELIKMMQHKVEMGSQSSDDIALQIARNNHLKNCENCRNAAEAAEAEDPEIDFSLEINKDGGLFPRAGSDRPHQNRIHKFLSDEQDL